MRIIRTIPEQVAKNAEDIEALKRAYEGGVDVDKVDFTNESLSASPDFEATLPDDNYTMTDVEAEKAVILLKSFIKRGYIIATGFRAGLSACKLDENGLYASFFGLHISIEGLEYSISY